VIKQLILTKISEICRSPSTSCRLLTDQNGIKMQLLWKSKKKNLKTVIIIFKKYFSRRKSGKQKCWQYTHGENQQQVKRLQF